MTASGSTRVRHGRLARTSRESLIFWLHVLVGVGLVVVGVRALLAARREGVGRRLALWALVVTVATFLSGVATVLTGSDWFSFLMAAGFLAVAALYGATFVLGSRGAAEVAGR